MCSNQDLRSVAAALLYLTTEAAKGNQAAQAHAEALAAVMARNAETRGAVADRRASQGTGSGRGPTTWFAITFGDQWATRVLGAKAAHELVSTTLTENPGNGAPPTLGSMQVALSKNGAWWRLLETDAGQHVLDVRKCNEPEA